MEVTGDGLERDDDFLAVCADAGIDFAFYRYVFYGEENGKMMSTATLVTFIVYLAGMLAIGLFFYRMTSNLSDYVLGGRSLGPGVAALSAGASDMSGWLLLGLPGAAYVSGFSAVWICIGLSAGAYLNWQFVARRLRAYTEVSRNSITIPDYLENRFRDHSKMLRVISAFVILLFFTFYASSGMVAGGKLFENSFGLQYEAALWIGAIVIISYTFLGGFLAVSWTDFVQGILMFIALLIVPIAAISEVGGWSEAVDKVGSIKPDGLDVFAGTTAIGIISSMAWGLGYFGQPHIITRFMALRSTRDVPMARLIGMVWMIAGLFGAIFTGFAGIAYFADTPLKDSETVFMDFSSLLFNPWISGILLAAILSAIMSTIDSQLLVSSSAVAEDFYKAVFRKGAGEKELVWVGRISVIVIALIAIILAMNPESSVLDLVSYAWGGFGAAFGPVIILSLFWKRMTRNGALAGLISGAATVVIWEKLKGGIFDLYEIVPGFLVCTAAIIIFSLASSSPDKEIEEEFEKAKASSFD
ncbi:sodium/proline symporter [Bacillus sp. NRRL B-14911]|uniref:Sodium/proline symporter n=2 Tax=Bacillaceae TaxID=186817 RepID=U5L6R2_9BACI|nr:proline:sodium symporter [Bacillus infantis NRRL B-14911]EAR67570.1 sodium/proline symporter [Bacillus sp. NRRL B-14911]